MILIKISNRVLRASSSEMPSMCQTSTRKYFSKTGRIKKLMTECKSVFGNLLETNSEKKRRLKLERKGKIRAQKQNKINTELSWVMKQSPNSLKRIIVLTKQRSEHENASQTNLTDSSENISTVTLEDKKPVNQNVENIFHRESNQSTQEITSKITNQNKLAENINSHDNTSSFRSSATDIENVTAKRSASEKFFDIVVKNIQSFSIMGNKRESSTKLTEMSISAKDDPKTIKFPSVTRILTHTMSPVSKKALEAWKERMIKELGKEGFDTYQKGIR